MTIGTISGSFKLIELPRQIVTWENNNITREEIAVFASVRTGSCSKINSCGSCENTKELLSDNIIFEQVLQAVTNHKMNSALKNCKYYRTQKIILLVKMYYYWKMQNLAL